MIRPFFMPEKLMLRLPLLSSCCCSSGFYQEEEEVNLVAPGGGSIGRLRPQEISRTSMFNMCVCRRVLPFYSSAKVCIATLSFGKKQWLGSFVARLWSMARHTPPPPPPHAPSHAELLVFATGGPGGSQRHVGPYSVCHFVVRPIRYGTLIC